MSPRIDFRTDIQIHEIPTKGHALDPYIFKLVIDCGYDGQKAKQILKQMIEDYGNSESWIKLYEHFKFFPIERMIWDEGNPDWEQFFKQCNENIEIQKRLKKEIAYAEWKQEQYEKQNGKENFKTINNHILSTLQIVDGSFSHDPDYDEEFEKEYEGKFSC